MARVRARASGGRHLLAHAAGTVRGGGDDCDHRVQSISLRHRFFWRPLSCWIACRARRIAFPCRGSATEIRADLAEGTTMTRSRAHLIALSLLLATVVATAQQAPVTPPFRFERPIV